MSVVAQILFGVLNLLNLLILLYCVLTWFSNINWYDQPFKTLRGIVQPILEPFRRIIPPIGNIDISPMVALLLLQFMAGMVRDYLR